MFYQLRDILEDIWNCETDVTFKDFEQLVDDAWAAGELSGTEYDWLMANIAEYN